MQKILPIGDIHGLDLWERLPLDKVDKVVFLGDYVDSFNLGDSRIIQNLQNIIQYKKDNPDKVVLLWGNHDLMYLFSNSLDFRCAGYRGSYANILYHLFYDNRNLFQIAYQEKDWLFTHAGLTQNWLDFNQNLIFDLRSRFGVIINDYETILNIIFSSSYYTILTQHCLARGGTVKYGSPIWADLHAEHLLEQTRHPHINQVAGHSEIDSIVSIVSDDNYILSFVDTLVSNCDIKDLEGYYKIIEVE